jgi:hypothetical protein
MPLPRSELLALCLQEFRDAHGREWSPWIGEQLGYSEVVKRIHDVRTEASGLLDEVRRWTGAAAKLVATSGVDEIDAEEALLGDLRRAIAALRELDIADDIEPVWRESPLSELARIAGRTYVVWPGKRLSARELAVISILMGRLPKDAEQIDSAEAIIIAQAEAMRKAAKRTSVELRPEKRGRKRRVRS